MEDSSEEASGNRKRPECAVRVSGCRQGAGGQERARSYRALQAMLLTPGFYLMIHDVWTISLARLKLLSEQNSQAFHHLSI